MHRPHTTTANGATTTCPSSSVIDPATWRAIPLGDPERHPDCQWTIVAGDYADEGEPDLYMQISGEHPQQTAEFVLAAARQAASPIAPATWQDAYPDADWHRGVAPDSVIPLPADRLQRLDESAAADLIAETDAARAELARTDTKASIILAFAGTAFSVLAALAVLASGLAVPARIGLGVAVALLAAASAVALCVIRPSLPRRGGTGFVSHAEAGDVDELLEQLAADPETRRAKDVIRLSQIARAKYRRLRLAVGLMLAALAVVVASLPLGAL
ncbi:Pycsar system effector family protein [Streptosporangium canum]|uniref:Pycsar system effector family protein n=1 Tax=Streptosporangium canum TaxID=324952 RepID=UPI0037991A5E